MNMVSRVLDIIQSDPVNKIRIECNEPHFTKVREAVGCTVKLSEINYGSFVTYCGALPVYETEDGRIRITRDWRVLCGIEVRIENDDIKKIEIYHVG